VSLQSPKLLHCHLNSFTGVFCWISVITAVESLRSRRSLFTVLFRFFSYWISAITAVESLRSRRSLFTVLFRFFSRFTVFFFHSRSFTITVCCLFFAVSFVGLATLPLDHQGSRHSVIFFVLLLYLAAPRMRSHGCSSYWGAQCFAHTHTHCCRLQTVATVAIESFDRSKAYSRLPIEWFSLP
jgi:hypothetical protein